MTYDDPEVPIDSAGIEAWRLSLEHYDRLSQHRQELRLAAGIDQARAQTLYSQTLGLETFQAHFSHYPVASYTQRPTLTNYAATQESLTEFLSKAAVKIGKASWALVLDLVNQIRVALAKWFSRASKVKEALLRRQRLSAQLAELGDLEASGIRQHGQGELARYWTDLAQRLTDADGGVTAVVAWRALLASLTTDTQAFTNDLMAYHGVLRDPHSRLDFQNALLTTLQGRPVSQIGLITEVWPTSGTQSLEFYMPLSFQLKTQALHRHAPRDIDVVSQWLDQHTNALLQTVEEQRLLGVHLAKIEPVLRRTAQTHQQYLDTLPPETTKEIVGVATLEAVRKMTESLNYGMAAANWLLQTTEQLTAVVGRYQYDCLEQHLRRLPASERQRVKAALR